MRADRETRQKMARLFRNGRNQSVRIPRGMEFGGKAVYVTRRGDEVILSARPTDWTELVQSKAVVSDGFLKGTSWNGSGGGL